MKKIWYPIGAMLIAVMLLTACAQGGAPMTTPESSTVPSTEAAQPTETTAPVQEPAQATTVPSQVPGGDKAPNIVTDAVESQPIPFGTTTPAAQSTFDSSHPIVAQAIADLAQRLNIPAADIRVIEAKNVTWADGSLGCPKPGMAYTQVLQDGMQIELGVGDQVYDYHSGESKPPFLCEQP